MFLLPANALYTLHQGQLGGRGLSPRIWNRVFGQGASPDGFSNARFVYDDFNCFATASAVAANVGYYSSTCGGYYSYEDTGGSITQSATNQAGTVAIATDSTDNDEMWLQPGMATSVMALISDTAGSDLKCAFEARIKTSKVTDTYNAFVGLTQEGTAVADQITDAGALADVDYIGFSITEADGDSLKFVYKKSGQTAQTVLTYGTALAADTFYKVGFVYDPLAPSSKRITVYVDNEEQSTYVTGTNIAAATFPDGEELQPLFGIKNGTGATTTLTMDWWAFYQAGQSGV